MMTSALERLHLGHARGFTLYHFPLTQETPSLAASLGDHIKSSMQPKATSI